MEASKISKHIIAKGRKIIVAALLMGAGFCCHLIYDTTWKDMRESLSCVTTLDAWCRQLLNDNLDYPDHLPVTTQLSRKCDCCEGYYIYHPTPPSFDKDASRFIMWCPAPCHHGKRAFLFADATVRFLGDSEVSWYYQQALENLDEEMIIVEQEYRMHNSIPLLEN